MYLLNMELSQKICPCFCVSEMWEEDTLNSVLQTYLEALDSRQRTVEEIRLLHHKVWSKNKEKNSVIIQHRSGSRVEKQTRICPNGTQSDIDFMLEVGVITVSLQTDGNMFFQPTSNDGYYGRIMVNRNYRDDLIQTEKLNEIFTTPAFEMDKFSNQYVLVPMVFKANVLSVSGFQYIRRETHSSMCPSVPGKGVINEYDVVPCLKLKQWPGKSLSWIHRGKHKTVFERSWRMTVYNKIPVFLIPTGEPKSYFQDREFRASFSMVEIECFKTLPISIRRLFGLAKYIFGRILSSVDLLSWFHVKYLLFWMVEEEDSKYWEDTLPLSFLMQLMAIIRRSVREGTVRHFFLDDCNIFPGHKRTHERECSYARILSDKQLIIESIQTLLQIELQVPLMKLSTLEASVRPVTQLTLKSYLDGYLTRLLSVIVHVWQELRVTQSHCNKFTGEILKDCRQTEFTAKLVPIVELYFIGNTQDTDRLNSWTHHAFITYMEGNIEKSFMLCVQNRDRRNVEECVIGITITKHHRDQNLDLPLLYALNQLEQRFGTCPRIYLHPLFFMKHVFVQYELRKHDIYTTHLLETFSDLENFSTTLCQRTPYSGSLSYRSVAMLVLAGYNDYFKNKHIDINPKLSTHERLDNHVTAVTSFDLQ